MSAYTPCRCTATVCQCHQQGTQPTWSSNCCIYATPTPAQPDFALKKTKFQKPPKTHAERRQWWNR